MRHPWQWGLLPVVIGIFSAGAAAADSVEKVDTGLVLAIDVSGSVNDERYALQMEGVAKAFEDEDIQQSILSGAHKAMFVTLVEWSTKSRISLPWTLIASRADAMGFAAAIRHAPRVDSQFTCASAALEMIQAKVVPFLPMPAERVVVDVSGDGHDNCNPAVPVDAVRDDLVAAGATINGLPVLDGAEAGTIEGWYRDHVIGGKDAFMIPAHGYDDFNRAMQRKFLSEISSR